jgi:Calcium/calmodulin dependent protein kinase II association domain
MPVFSCFEPEAVGNLVEGLTFLKFYFNRQNSTRGSIVDCNNKRVNTTMVRPHVRVLAGGHAAVVSYIRLTQEVLVPVAGSSSQLQTAATRTRASEETRVWERNASTGNVDECALSSEQHLAKKRKKIHETVKHLDNMIIL